MDIRIKSAADIPFDALVDLFNAGYAGYSLPVQVDSLELRHHIEQHSIDLSASRIAFFDSQMAGVGLLGIRGDHGWIGGLGVHPAYRRKGIGRSLMNALIDQGRAQSLTTIQLEVIDTNTAAYDLYRSVGFVDIRRLLVLGRPPAPVSAREKCLVALGTAKDVLSLQSVFHKTFPPWQRHRDSLEPSAPVWITPNVTKPAAYVIGYATASLVHILDLACAEGQEEALQSLLIHIFNCYPDAVGRLINLGEDEPAWTVLSLLGWAETLCQNEMKLLL